MANELDEMTGPVSEEGRDVHVIQKQVAVKTDWRSTLFQVALWICGIIPGIIFAIMKIKARSYLQQLQQKIQHDASTIDNYQTQRVVVLQNCAKLLDKAIDLDKTVLTDIAKYRGGNVTDQQRNELAGMLDGLSRSINVAFEAYPDIKAHREIADAMQQNSYLQQEVTAAREVYNDTVMRWNADIFAWPTKMIVAAKAGYTTRIPFTASKEMKEKSESVFF
ncbi:MAG TPA: LemA family protein [Candidatus Enteromonas pullicola]|uniref:LemA family protein n=1 Tax=Candidatus Alloenteromonas pullicola TaxID=2840784 RepID=A0A9D1LMZ3_9FIRM|nr:LemA family protein [Candidatus Enteromonas pullicola]